MVRLTIFNLLLVPSTKPLLRLLATGFSTAQISFSKPFAKEAKYYHMDPDNLETWNIKGHKVLVAFDIVKKEDKSNAIKVFWKDVRDHMKQDKPDPMLCSYEELTEATADDHYGENKSYLLCPMSQFMVY